MLLPRVSTDRQDDGSRHYLIAAGTASYDYRPFDDQLMSVKRDLRLIVNLFERELRYERVLPELGDSPTAQELRSALEEWLRSDQRRPDDVIVLYYSGHGFTDEDGLHYLCARDTRVGRTANAVATEEVARWLADSPVQHLLAIVDTCYSGQGITDLAAVAGRVWGRRARDETAGSGLFFAASARTGDVAEAGASAFPEALALAVADQRAARVVPPYLDLGAVMDSVNAEFKRRRLRQRARWAVAVSGGACRALRNPRNVEGMPTGIDLDTQGRLARNPDLLRHWGPRARGVEVEGQPGWHFTGRTTVLRRLVSWLERLDDPRPRVVTGRPGSGKSAVLARLVTLSDPEYRKLVPLHDAPNGTVPPPGAIDVAVHARNKSLKDVTASLAAAVGASSNHPQALIETLAARDRPLVVVLDAVDEAIEPRRIGRDLLRPLLAEASGGIRLLVGTRSEHLQAVGQDRVELDLDELDPPEIVRADLRDYVRRVLIAEGEPGVKTAYQNRADVATEVAAAVSDQAFPSFLVARIVARTLAAQDMVNLSDDGWRKRFPSTVAEAMEGDLARFGADQERIRDLLRPLAWAEGAGLPWKGVWASLATALSGGEPYDDSDIEHALSHAGSYIVEGEESGRSVYRLYHQALTDHLRGQEVESAAQKRIVGALLDTVPLVDRRRDWATAEPYVRTYLATHAHLAGDLDTLIGEVRYLLAAEPGPLLRSLSGVVRDSGQRTARAYRRAVHHLHTAAHDERAAYLQLIARQSGAEEIADRLGATMPELPWSARWAYWRPAGEHRIAGRHAAGVRSLAVGIVERRPVVVSGGLDGVVRTWDLSDSGAVGAPQANPGGFVSAVALGTIDDRLVIVSGGADGRVRVRDLADGGMIWEAPRGHSLAISALAVGVIHGRPVVVAGADNGYVQVWDLRDGTLRRSLPRGHQVRVLAVAAGMLWRGPIPSIVAAGADGRIRVWDADSGEQLDLVRISSDEGALVAVTLDDVEREGVAISIDRDGYAAVWNLAAAKEQNRILIGGQPLAVTSVRLQEGRIVVAAGNDGLVRLSEAETDTRVVPPLVGHVGSIHAVATAMVDDQLVVISGGADGTVRVWDLSSNSAADDTVVERIRVALAVAPTAVDGVPAVASVGLGGSLHVTAAQRGHVAHHLVDYPELTGSVTAIATSVLGHRPVIVAGGLDGTLRVWDPALGVQVRPPRSSLHTRLTSVAVAAIHGRAVVVAAGSGGAVEVLELDSGRRIGVLRTPDGWFARVVTIGGTAEQPVIVAGGSDGSLILADIATGELKGHVAAHRGSVEALAAGTLHGVPVAISSGQDGVLWIWDLAVKPFFPALLAFNDHRACALSVDIGQLRDGAAVIVSGGNDGAVMWWSPTGEPLRTIDVGAPVLDVAFIEGSAIAIASSMGLLLMDVATTLR